MEVKIGIVIADVDEYKPIVEYAQKIGYKDYNPLKRTGHQFAVETEKGRADILAINCGIGKVNAAAATMRLIDDGCDIILNFGLSGGVSGISRGEICLCNKFLEHDFDLTGIGYKPCEKPLQEYIYNADEDLINLFKSLKSDVKLGTAVCGDSFVCDEAVRNFLKTEFNAMSCDMETAAIGYVCAFSDIPYLSLRKISDDAGSSAEDAYKEMNSSDDTSLFDYFIELIKIIINSEKYGKKA